MADEIERWKTYVSVWEGEASRFWIRNNVFLIVSGALFSVVAGLSERPIVSVVVSIVGIVVSYGWLRSNEIGKHYVDRWKVFIEEAEGKMDDAEGFCERLPALKQSSPVASLRSSTYYMSFVVKCLIAGWFVLLIIFIAIGIVEGPLGVPTDKAPTTQS